MRKHKDPPQSVHHVIPKSKHGLVVNTGARLDSKNIFVDDFTCNGIDVDFDTTIHEVGHESYLAGTVFTVT